MWKSIAIMWMLVSLVVGAGATFPVSASGSITGPGNAAITGYNADGNDSIAFVLLGDTTPNQVIYFTDNEWNGSPIGSGGAFNTGEGFLIWTAPATPLVAGTVIEITDASTTTPTTTQGLVTRSGSFNLGSVDEVLYMYLGASASAPTAFLTAFANDDFGFGTIDGTGLIEGVTAMRFEGVDADVDVAQYAGSRTNQSSAAGYLTLIMDAGNWEHQDGTGDQSQDGVPPDTPFDTTPFTKPNAVIFAGMNARGGVGNGVLIALLIGFSVLLCLGFWLRRRAET